MKTTPRSLYYTRPLNFIHDFLILDKMLKKLQKEIESDVPGQDLNICWKKFRQNLQFLQSFIKSNKIFARYWFYIKTFFTKSTVLLTIFHKYRFVSKSFFLLTFLNNRGQHKKNHDIF